VQAGAQITTGTSAKISIRIKESEGDSMAIFGRMA
jgi:hypothetical protein